MKSITILGSTGSIGRQALEVAKAHNDIEITALAAGSNIELLEQQIRQFKPKLACVYYEDKARQLRASVRDLNVRIEAGMEGLIACGTAEADMVLAAMVGMIGIRPTIEAIKAGRNIALANKETLVTAGHIIMPLIKEKNVSLLPVDSEHSAIFQSLKGEDGRYIHKIILTASGGPFYGRTTYELKNVTPEEALRHPNWLMGPKITVDSATMVNKGLEVMEAKWLFDVEVENIQVLVHRQSIIHSMVEFCDGSIIAQMGVPDMRLPIKYAMYYPERLDMKLGERVDFIKLGKLTFEEPDYETFSGLALGIRAAGTGHSMPAVYNAANEWAVARFLERRISFTDIPLLIGKAMDNHRPILNPSLDEILNTESETYDYMREITGIESDN
jgi:1-deoxy-D-xylulose-5-phosphate reductoisomerase